MLLYCLWLCSEYPGPSTSQWFTNIFESTIIDIHLHFVCTLVGGSGYPIHWNGSTSCLLSLRQLWLGAWEFSRGKISSSAWESLKHTSEPSIVVLTKSIAQAVLLPKIPLLVWGYPKENYFQNLNRISQPKVFMHQGLFSCSLKVHCVCCRASAVYLKSDCWDYFDQFD